MITTEALDYAAAFPREFEFYHLGEVRPSTGTTPPEQIDWSDSEGVAFTLNGDLRGLIVVLFSRMDDAGIELSNVLASRFATRLSAQFGIETMISPPKLLKAQDLKALPDPRATGAVIKTYHYQDNPVQLVVFTAAASPAEAKNV